MNRSASVSSRVTMWTLAFLLALPLVWGGTAQAGTYTWDQSGGAPLNDGGGNWNASGGSNWFDGVATYDGWGNTTNDVAVFGVATGAAGTITAGTVNANGITFNAPGSGTYTLTGGTITLGGAAPTITANANGIISSSVAGAGFTKAGTGVLYADGNNSYSGVTTVSAGYLVARHNNALGAADGTVVNSGATLQLENVSGDVAVAGETCTITGTGVDGRGALHSWSGNNAWNGPVVLSGNATVAAQAGTLTINGVISGSPLTVGSAVNGGASVVLAGSSANTYTGLTTVNRGNVLLSKSAGVAAIPGDIQMANGSSPNLWMTAGGQLGGSGVLSFTGDTGNARFDLFGTSQSLAGLNESNAGRNGVVQNSEAINGAPSTTSPGTLTLTGSGSYSYNGYLRNVTGPLTVIMNGTGTQTFNINSNQTDRMKIGSTYWDIGAFTVNSGTVNVQNTYIVFGESGGALAQYTQTGGTVNHTGTGGVWISNGTGAPSQMTINGGTFNDTAGGAMMIGQSPGGGTLTVNGSSAVMNLGGEMWIGVNYAGAVNLNAGSITQSGQFFVVGNAAGGGTYTQTGGTYTFTGVNGSYLGNGSSGTGTMTVSGGTFTQTQNVMRVGQNGSSIGILNIGGGSGTAVVSAPTVTFGANSGSAAGTINLYGNGILSAGTINKGGGAGTFNFNGGTLQASLSNAGFMSGLTAANVQSGGAIIDTQAYSITIGQALLDGGGGGGLTKVGSGTLTLSGANTYTGGTTVSGGTLKLDLAARSGSVQLGAVSVGPAGTLDLYNTNTTVDNVLITGSSAITGSGTLRKTGPGYVGLWNDSDTIKDFTGYVDVQAGTLGSNGNGWENSAGLMDLNIAGGASFDMRTQNVKINKLTGAGAIYSSFSAATLIVGNNNGSATFGGTITNGLSLTKNGSGTQTLGGVNTHSGTTTISGGTLKLQAPATALPSSIAGLQVWLDANDVNATGSNPADGTQLSAWANKAVGGIGNLTGGASPYLNWTGNLMNGHPVVHFWGGSLANGYNFGNNLTVLYVGRMDGGTNQRLLDSNYGSGGNNWLLGYWGGAMNQVHWNNGGVTGSPATDYNSHIFLATGDGTTANAYNIDGSESLFDTRTFAGGAQGPNGLRVGGGGEPSYGDIGEVLVFNRALTSSERLQMEQYLQSKWYGVLPCTTAVNLTAGGATLDLGGVHQTIGSLAGVAGSGVLLNGGVLTVGQNNASTSFSGVIANGTTGGGGLSKIGTGTLTLDGPSANTFTGPTQISRGYVALSKTAGVTAIPGDIQMVNSMAPTIWTTADNQLGGTGVLSFVNEVNTFVTGGNARFNLEGATQTLAGIVETDAYRAGVIQNSESAFGGPNNTGTGTLVLAGGGNHSFNGYLRNANGTLALTKTGSGTQTLVGDRITYTGATTINSGTLDLYNASAMASPTTVNSGGTLKLDGSANVGHGSAFTIQLNDGATLIHANANAGGAAWDTLAGAVSNSGSTTVTIAATSGNNQPSLYFDGGLTGSGTMTINTTSGYQGVNFRNNNSTFAGTLIVNGIANTAAGAGSGIGVGGCTTGLQNADITLNGTMELLNQGIGWANGAPGDFWMGALNGTGVMVANFTSGGQTRVRIGSTNNSGTFSGVIADGTGDQVVLTKIGSGTQALNGSSTFTGTDANGVSVSINGGTLSTSNLQNSGVASGLGSSGSIGLRGGILQYTGAGGGTNRRLEFGTGTQTIDASGTGALTLNGSIGTDGVGGSRTLNLTGSSTAANTFAIVVADTSGTWSVTKNGAGTWVFNQADTYTGQTTVNGGTLQLTDIGNHVFNSPVTVNANGTLVINSSISFLTRWNYNKTLSGTGTFIKQGAGVFGIDGTNNFAGQMYIQAGRLMNDNVTGNWTGATADADISSGAVLDLRANDIHVDSLTGVAGAEIWNSHTAGGTRTLFVGVANGSGTFGGSIRGIGGTGNDTPDAAAIKLEKRGTGTQTLTGASTYSGGTTINAGTLLVNNTTGSGTGSGPVVVNAGGTLGGTGTIAGTVSGAGVVSPGASPGTLTAGAINPAGGLDFNFEYTNPAGSTPGNDMLVLTAADPFTAALNGTNRVNAFLNIGQLTPDQVFAGGFRSSPADLSDMTAADWNFFVRGDGNGSVTFEGARYYPIRDYNVDFFFTMGLDGQGTLVLDAQAPEPATMILLGLAATSLGGYIRRRRS